MAGITGGPLCRPSGRFGGRVCEAGGGRRCGPTHHLPAGCRPWRDGEGRAERGAATCEGGADGAGPPGPARSARPAGARFGPGGGGDGGASRRTRMRTGWGSAAGPRCGFGCRFGWGLGCGVGGAGGRSIGAREPALTLRSMDGEGGGRRAHRLFSSAGGRGRTTATEIGGTGDGGRRSGRRFATRRLGGRAKDPAPRPPREPARWWSGSVRKAIRQPRVSYHRHRGRRIRVDTGAPTKTLRMEAAKGEPSRLLGTPTSGGISWRWSLSGRGSAGLLKSTSSVEGRAPPGEPADGWADPLASRPEYGPLSCKQGEPGRWHQPSSSWSQTQGSRRGRTVSTRSVGDRRGPRTFAGPAGRPLVIDASRSRAGGRHPPRPGRRDGRGHGCFVLSLDALTPAGVEDAVRRATLR